MAIDCLLSLVIAGILVNLGLTAASKKMVLDLKLVLALFSSFTLAFLQRLSLNFQFLISRP